MTEDKEPMFSMHINLGNILTLIGMVISLFAFWGAISGRFVTLEVETSMHTQQMVSIEGKVDTLGAKLQDLTTKEVRQEQKLEDERRHPYPDSKTGSE